MIYGCVRIRKQTELSKKRSILRDLPSGCHRCMDPTLPNLAKTQSDHGYTRILFQSSDVLRHIQMRAAQS